MLEFDTVREVSRGGRDLVSAEDCLLPSCLGLWQHFIASCVFNALLSMMWVTAARVGVLQKVGKCRVVFTVRGERSPCMYPVIYSVCALLSVYRPLSVA